MYEEKIEHEFVAHRKMIILNRTVPDARGCGFWLTEVRG